MSTLEAYFEPFRRSIIGNDQHFETPFGRKRILYADWIASGRLYETIERRIVDEVGPLVGNTHSESSVTGTTMTRAYDEAREIIKRHVKAGPDDVIITHGSGMTSVVNKFQRILGLRVSEKLLPRLSMPDEDRPLVVVTHMEHHSNHTSWLETIAIVECMQPDDQGLCDLGDLERILDQHKNRSVKIGAFTACSNVTGVRTPYHKMARIMHEHGGVCFVDFAASAPYDAIDMHPANPLERLDAIYFSPHKFLGGPGSCGVIVFDSKLDSNHVPDCSGGGTVNWTNPWGGRSYLGDLEAREDGGTPGFLQAIRAAMAIRLKEEMGVEQIHDREAELLGAAFERLGAVPNLHLLAGHLRDRLGVISFYIDDLHYNLIVKLLNDRYGIQVRGGCSCAGTYGHYLLHVDPQRSREITDKIDQGDLSSKPGWVRLSVHPTMTDDEVESVLDAIEAVAKNGSEWVRDYRYCAETNEFVHKRNAVPADNLHSLFDVGVAVEETRI